ncbi:unnamed protein product [Protopolystoma xenopodis]|uniref:Uncharacterized protein n=1 Tax=Protopolystoma xenopodis TaxID=117903 RepID=A0A448WNX6_9PLAT|nr:unnamed protein product [Protopolystoma xenopodis]
MQSELARMAAVYEKQTNVLRRRAEAANAAESRLREVLQRQRDVKQERQERKLTSSNANGNISGGLPRP